MVLHLALAAILIPSAVWSQDTVRSVRYANGSLNTDYLPYGVRFKIVGSTALPEGRADVVRLIVTPKDVSEGKPDSSCWVRPTGPAGDALTDFDVFAPRTLRLEKSYKLKLEFYQRIAPDARAAIRRAVEAVVTTLEERYADDLSDVVVESQTVAAAWSEAAAAQLKDLIGDKAVTLDVRTVGRCPIGDAAPLVTIKHDHAVVLARAVAARLDLERRRNELNDALKQLRAVTLDPAHNTLRERLKARLGRALAPPIAPPLPYSRADVDALYDAFDNERVVPSETVDRMRALLGHPQQARVINMGHSGHLADLLFASRLLERAEERLRSDSTTFAIRMQVAAELDVLNPLYEVQATASMTSHSWTDTAHVRALRIGTAYAVGVGAPSLIFGGESEPSADVVSMVFVKLHLGAVDKRFPEAYSSAWAKVAFNVGALFLSNLHYRGQEQAHLLIGITPAIGISWDFNRFMALHLGGLLFRQPSVNPLNKDEKRGPLGALYVAVGFDFNILNRLKDLAK